MTLQLGEIGAWLHPMHGDEARTTFAVEVEVEVLGYGPVWLGLGAARVADLALVDRILDRTSPVTVATAIVSMWTNDAAGVARSFRDVAAAVRGHLAVGADHVAVQVLARARRGPHARFPCAG